MESSNESLEVLKQLQEKQQAVISAELGFTSCTELETIPMPETERIAARMLPCRRSVTNPRRIPVFNKYHRKALAIEVDEKPFPFEEEFSRGFWKQVHEYESDAVFHGHTLDGYEAFQFLRVDRLKANNNKTPDVDPLAAIIHQLGSHYDHDDDDDDEDDHLCCDEDFSNPALTKGNIVDFLSYYLYFDYQENKQNETDSIYQDLIEDGPGLHKTIIHILLEEKLHFCVPLVLRLYPDLIHISTRGGHVVSGMDMCLDASESSYEIHDALSPLLQRSVILYDGSESCVDPWGDVEPVIPVRLTTDKKYRDVEQYEKKELHNWRSKMQELNPCVIFGTAATIVESRGERYETAKHQLVRCCQKNVFVLFVESLQSKFARKLCSVLEIVSQGSLQVEDMESLLRSPSQNIAKSLNEAKAVVMVASPGLQRILEQDQPNSSVATGLLANTPTEDLRRFIDGFKDATVSGQEIIYLRDSDTIPERIKEMKVAKYFRLLKDAHKFNKLLRVTCTEIYQQLKS